MIWFLLCPLASSARRKAFFRTTPPLSLYEYITVKEKHLIQFCKSAKKYAVIFFYILTKCWQKTQFYLKIQINKIGWEDKLTVAKELRVVNTPRQLGWHFRKMLMFCSKWLLVFLRFSFIYFVRHSLELWSFFIS